MKTQILRLDPHDDVISTRDKMNWGQTGRILLLWPEHGRVLRRRVDLVLLHRHSNSLGAQLALVTNDPLVRFHAHYLAIPVFKNLRQAQSAHWRVDRQHRVRQATKFVARPLLTSEALEELRQGAHPPTPAWLSKPFARLGFFGLGVIALLALAAVLLPGAEVSLTPETQSQQLTITVRADPDQQDINYSGIVPARPISVIVEGRDSIEASGVDQVADKPSTGNVVFTNLSDQPVKIPVGLVVRSVSDPSVRFATIEAVEVAAGPGITTTLAVRAVTPGKGSNLPAGSLNAIEGDFGLILAATNPAPTAGGTERTLPVPTIQDRKRLYEKLETALRTSALNEVQSQLAPDDLLFTPTLTITKVLDETYTPSSDQPSEQLQLNLRLEFQILSVFRSDLENLAVVLLDTNLPNGFVPVPGDIVLRQDSPPIMEDGSIASWRVTAVRDLKADIQPAQVTNLLLGIPPDQAVARLSAALPMEAPPVIRLTPHWWPRLPVLPFRIVINENLSR